MLTDTNATNISVLGENNNYASPTNILPSETTSTSEYSTTETKVTPTGSNLTQKTDANTKSEDKITTKKEPDEFKDRRAFNPLLYDKEGISVPSNIDVTSKKISKVTTNKNTTFLHVTKNPKKPVDNRQVQILTI